jgi:hypothetical protein
MGTHLDLAEAFFYRNSRSRKGPKGLEVLALDFVAHQNPTRGVVHTKLPQPVREVSWRMRGRSPPTLSPCGGRFERSTASYGSQTRETLREKAKHPRSLMVAVFNTNSMIHSMPYPRSKTPYQEEWLAYFVVARLD